MMKFMFEGHLFRFFKDWITIVTPFGDKWKIELTDDPNNPFIFKKIKIYDYDSDHEQLQFERELKAEELV